MIQHHLQILRASRGIPSICNMNVREILHMIKQIGIGLQWPAVLRHVNGMRGHIKTQVSDIDRCMAIKWYFRERRLQLRHSLDVTYGTGQKNTRREVAYARLTSIVARRYANCRSTTATVERPSPIPPGAVLASASASLRLVYPYVLVYERERERLSAA